jgi:hypothetical protein
MKRKHLTIPNSLKDNREVKELIQAFNDCEDELARLDEEEKQEEIKQMIEQNRMRNCPILFDVQENE